MTTEEAELQGLTDEQRAHYERVRAHGESHGWALMVATRTFPGVTRRDERWRGTQDGKRMGVRGVRGKYQPGLAEYPGDPHAFCESMGDARRRAEQIGAKITDRPNNAEGGRQELLKKARKGDAAAAAALEK